MQTIWVSKGEVEYVGGTVTETTGDDISGIDITVGLSTSGHEPPDAEVFAEPDVDDQGATEASRTLKKLVDDSIPLGAYYLWASIPDTPENPYVMLAGPIYVK